MDEEDILPILDHKVSLGTTRTQEKSKVSQEQIHDLLFSRELSWQAILYDLINTEQLDPWDIDLRVLADRYLEKIHMLEEMNFLISSKVLLAAALLLYLKSEILLSKELRSIDDILFGRKEETKKYELERIELDEEIPELVPKSPLPRSRRVSLQELIASLSRAITTENRRIKKHILEKNAFRESSISLPDLTKININDSIRDLYTRIVLLFEEEKNRDKISFSDLVGEDKKERIASFLPLLHLDNQKKIWIQQDKSFDEIYVWESKNFKQKNDIYAGLREHVESIEEDIDESKVQSEEEAEAPMEKEDYASDETGIESDSITQ